MSNTNYTESPACRLLAANCACCGKPLVDAVSTETGVGPDCRKLHGYDQAQEVARWMPVHKALDGLVAIDTSDSHALANRLVRLVAVEQSGANVARYIEAIASLGFVRLAKRIAKRLHAVQVETTGSVLRVSMSYDQSTAMLEALRQIPGRRWDREEKVNLVPVSSRELLWRALRKALPRGTLVMGQSVAAL